MSFSKKFAVLSAAILSLQALPALGASASNALSAEQAALADAYAYLADFGADESVLAAAVNSNGLDVHDYLAVYYSKSNAVNKDFRFASRTFYSDAIIPYGVYDEITNTTSSIIPKGNTESISESGASVTGGHTLDYTCLISPRAANEKLFYVMLERGNSTASATSVSPHAFSLLWEKDSNGKYLGRDWDSYIDCDVVGLGDVNLDGRIDIQDSVFAAQIANGTCTFTNRRKQIVAADVNGDGAVTQADVDDINRYLAHFITCFYWTAYDYI